MIEQDILENQVSFVYLGIGSNLGNKINNIELAKSKLILNDIMIVKSSSYMRVCLGPIITILNFIMLWLRF